MQKALDSVPSTTKTRIQSTNDNGTTGHFNINLYHYKVKLKANMILSLNSTEA
jgi:hypothetical protein